jgi:hypothetical protein
MQQITLALIVMLVITILGCSDDTRLAELAQETNRQQAQQNQEMAKLNQEVAAGSKHIAQASAQATEKILSMEKDLQARQDELEIERKELAQERKIDSLLGTFLVTAAALIAVALPLILSWYLLHSLQKQGEPAVTDLLLEELDRATSAPAISVMTSDSPQHLEV